MRPCRSTRTAGSCSRAGPDGPAQKSTGTATFEWAVPGKWIHWHGDGDMFGMPVKQFGMMGYDNFKQKYVASWHSSLETTLSVAEGTLTQDGKRLMLWGSMDEPMTGQTDKTVRYDYIFRTADEIVVQVHDLHIGTDKTKVVEVVYKRKK